MPPWGLWMPVGNQFAVFITSKYRENNTGKSFPESNELVDNGHNRSLD
jgi:hypothetical protein